MRKMLGKVDEVIEDKSELTTTIQIGPLISFLFDQSSYMPARVIGKGMKVIDKLSIPFNNSSKNESMLELEQASKAILSGLGSISALAAKSSVEDYNISTQSTWRREINATENKFFDVLGKVTNSLKKKLSTGQDPLTIESPQLSLSIGKYTEEDTHEGTNISFSDTSVILPSFQSMNITNKENDNFTLEVLQRSFLLNKWTNGSAKVNSVVVDVDILLEETKIQVTNYSSPISLQLPGQAGRFRPLKMSFYHFLENKHFLAIFALHTKEQESLVIKVWPLNPCSNLTAVLRFDKRPNLQEYDYLWYVPMINEDMNVHCPDCKSSNSSNWLPHNSSCDALNSTLDFYLERKDDCFKEEKYKFFVPEKDVRTGVHYLGIYRSTDQLTKEQQRILLQTYNCSNADHIALQNYSFSVLAFQTSCICSSVGKGWTSEGCQVSPETTIKKTHCSCSRYSSFASSFFVAPNEIDLKKVIAGFQNIKDNLSVLAFLCVLVAFYIIVTIFLRRKDKADIEKLSVSKVKPDNEDAVRYLVVIFTGARQNAGTSANVFITLHGEHGSTPHKPLCDNYKAIFQRHQVSAFQLSFQEDVGSLLSIRLWHNNRGKSPSWFISRVYIENLSLRKQYRFVCERWLALDQDDGAIDRFFPVASQQDLVSFRHLFTTKAARDFSEAHLWLSVLLKPPHSMFTRVQRLTCCFVLLFASMVASAMFFSAGDEAVSEQYMLHFGSIKINLRGVVIGIQSSLITMPVSLLIAYLFRKKTIKVAEHCLSSKEESSHKSMDKNANKTPQGTLGENRKREKALKQSFSLILPIVAWILSFLTCTGSLVVILFYSMMWGDSKSQAWLVTVVTTFAQSAFVVQPIKLIAVALVLSFIFPKPQIEDKILMVYRNSRHYISDYVKLGLSDQKEELTRLTKSEQQNARQESLNKTKMQTLFKDLSVYLLFLALLTIIVLSYRDPKANQLQAQVKNLMLRERFKKIKSFEDVWNWMHFQFIPVLFKREWYNGKLDRHKSATYLKPNVRIGQVRTRQLRVIKGKCFPPSIFHGLIKECNTRYSYEDRDMEDYQLGWIQKHMLHPHKERKRRSLKIRVDKVSLLGTKLAYKDLETIYTINDHLSRETRLFEVNDFFVFNNNPSFLGIPHLGCHALYDGGGYMAILGNDQNEAHAKASLLQEANWIDHYARALSFEFTLYNPDINVFATAFIFIEITPETLITSTGHMKLIQLYRYSGLFSKFVIACEVSLLLVFLYFFYLETKKCWKCGWKYFTQFWNLVELTIAVSLLAAIALWIIRWLQEDKIRELYRQQTTGFVAYTYAAAASEALMLALSIILFLSVIKLLKLLQIFPFVAVLSNILANAVVPLLHYSIPFFLVFLGFAAFASLTFNRLELFMSFSSTLDSQFMILLGGPILTLLKQEYPILGPSYYFVFILTETFWFLNIFLAIVDNLISTSSQEVQSTVEMLSFYDYVKGYLVETVLTCLPYSSPLPANRHQLQSVIALSRTEFTKHEYESKQTSSVEKDRKRKRKYQIQREKLLNIGIKLDQLHFLLDRVVAVANDIARSENLLNEKTKDLLVTKE